MEFIQIILIIVLIMLIMLTYIIFQLRYQEQVNQALKRIIEKMNATFNGLVHDF